jgi:tetratricopeptide (TPR) repeat protein
MTRGGAQYSVAELVAKAEALVDQCQPELAVQFYEKAVLQEPANASLLDSVGELSTELDNPERALAAFQQSVALAPTQNASKYFYLSQLVAGEQAEQYSTQGIQLLQHELQQHVDPSTPAALTIKKQICDALCSLGELYMTDLCDHEEAETRCENYFQEAMKFDVGLPEPTQALANLRLVQQNKEAADGLLEETYRRLNENCDEDSLPSLEFRTATGKMLIEVERYEQACDVLEGVMQEDDENAELWFLVGTCYRAMDDLPNALEFFEKCRTMLNKLKKELRDEFYLQDQLDSVIETIAELKTSIANRPPELDEESGSDDESVDAETVGQQDVDMED